MTWAKSNILSILKSWDFNCKIDGNLFICLKFNIAPHSIVYVLFTRSLLIRVVFMEVSFTTSVKDSPLSNNTCTGFFVGLLSKLVREYSAIS